MTDLERAVADALRLSDSAATGLLSTIQRNIATAKAELIRSGCPADDINAGGSLIDDCIICWCMAHMGDESMMERYLGVFQNQQDNLRKSL